MAKDVRVVENQFPARTIYEKGQEEASVILEIDEPDVPISQSRPQPTNTPQLVEGTRAVQLDVQDDVERDEQVLDSLEAGESRQLSTEELDRVTYNSQLQDDATDVQENDVSPSDAESRYPRRERKQTSFYNPGSANTAKYSKNSHNTELPSTVKEALGMYDGDEWKKAIDSELESLGKHHTWKVVDRKASMKPLSTRFVFLRKFDENGHLIRHKARLVVRGFLQGFVDETFAPVVDFSSVRVMLALAVQRRYFIHQMDIKTAFLHEKIDTDVFITAPEGVMLCEPGKVLKLRRGLYGLKQAPKLWHDTWKSVMKNIGFRRLISDNCVFTRETVWLLLYVDDIILMGDSEGDIRNTKIELSNHFDVKDLGKVRSFLGIVFVRERKDAWLTQEHYVVGLLRRFGMKACKLVDTPMSTGAMKEFEEVDEEIVDCNEYQEMIGCLLFLAARTRPDISAAVDILSRYCSKLRRVHLVHLKRIFRYLQNTVNYGLKLSGTQEPLVGFCDSDWAGDRKDQRSTSGVLLKLGSTTVCWRTMKQTSVALSSTEAEFIAMSEATKLILSAKALLKELGVPDDVVTDLNVDNQGAIIWGQDEVRRAKHVSIRENFVRENVENETIRLVYCRTSLMTADILTKPLLRVAFEHHRVSLGVQKMGN